MVILTDEEVRVLRSFEKMFPVGNPDMWQAWSTVALEIGRDAGLPDEWAFTKAFNMLNHPIVLVINPFYGSGPVPLQSFGAPAAFAASRQIRFSVDFEY